jgi:hypothetical protein
MTVLITAIRLLIPLAISVGLVWYFLRLKRAGAGFAWWQQAILALLLVVALILWYDFFGFLLSPQFVADPPALS